MRRIRRIASCQEDAAITHGSHRKCCVPALLLGVLAATLGTGCRPGENAKLTEHGRRDSIEVLTQSVERRVASLNEDTRVVPPLMMRALGDGSATFGWVTSVLVLDDSIVLVSDRATSPHLATVNVRSGKIERRFGRNGVRQQQFRDPIWTTRNSMNDARAWVFDRLNRRLVLLNMRSRGEAMLERDLSVDPPETAGINAAGAAEPQLWALWSGERILTGGMLLDYTFLELDHEGRYQRRVAVDPPFSAAAVPFALSRQALSPTMVGIRPGQTHFAIAYQYAPRIDFFESGTRYVSVTGPRPVDVIVEKPSPEETGERRSHHIRVSSIDRSEIGYVTVTASTRFLYALFCGCRRGASIDARRLHVYEWDGTFKAEVEFDRAVSHLSVIGDSLVVGVYGELQSNTRALKLGTWQLPHLGSSPAMSSDALKSRDNADGKLWLLPSGS